jgi:DNA-3-methyladenine glycosylase II
MATQIHKTVPEWLESGKKYLAKERIFRSIIQRHPDVLIRPMRQIDLFRSLAHAIVSQQISGYAADAIFKRVCALFPDQRLDAAHLLTLSDGALRGAGLSNNKVRFMKDLARHVTDGRVPSPRELRRMSDEEIIEKLTDILGIGPWTVHMLLIFKLGRPDVFPSADIGIQRGFQRLLSRRQRPTPRFLDRYSVRWKPYRSLAAWYLWRASDDVTFSPDPGNNLWTKS